MPRNEIESLRAEIALLQAAYPIGRVSGVEAGLLRISGLERLARIGERLRVQRAECADLEGEVVALASADLLMLPDGPAEGVALGQPVALLGPADIAPTDAWLGRVIDPAGRALDGRPLLRGQSARPLLREPPKAATRRGFGPRLETGMAVMNTMLPLVRGQRIGLFAGSGVGKSSLLAHLAKYMQADVVVLALIGERGREVRDFIETVLGVEGMKRAVVVAATSDQSALLRRRCAWTAMAVAEHFRDQGQHVLFLADSITRFAEAHREVAVASGEAATLRGFPASTAHTIMSLCERAGPGEGESGDITAVFSVLVAGSDMDEPIADILRGTLDGHVVLDRQIAERGRYPAIDVLRSVSRSLPSAASEVENGLITEARRLLGAYQQSEVMIRAGLYVDGSDALLDRAISAWSELDGFLADVERIDSTNSFARLGLILRRAKPMRPSTSVTVPTPQPAPRIGVGAAVAGQGRILPS